MSNPRPIECPACGHDRPRRRGQEDSLFGIAVGGRVDDWVCGLCRYEWSTPARDVRSTLSR